MKTLQRLLHPLRQRIMFMLARGIVKLSNSNSNMQTLQITVLDGEVLADVEHFEPYGFTSRPLEGAEVLTASLAGNRSHTVVLCAADRRYRKLNLQPGEVCLFTNEGDYVHLKNGRVIDVVTQTLNITANTSNITGNLNVSGNVVAQGNVSDNGNKTMLGMRTVYNTHIHSDPQGGSVAPPAAQM